MTVETYEVKAPAHWASALINGDYTGIECDRECERISSFEESLYPGHIVDCEQESEFIWQPRWRTDSPDELAGDYLTYTVLVHKGGDQ